MYIFNLYCLVACIHRLYNNFNCDWKIIPLSYKNNILGKNLKFHSNLSIPNKTINYRFLNIILLILRFHLQFFGSFKIDRKVVCYKEFADKKKVSNLFDENEELKSQQKILSDFRLTQKSYFKWFQLIHVIPKSWKLVVLNGKENCKNIVYLNHL